MTARSTNHPFRRLQSSLSHVVWLPLLGAVLTQPLAAATPQETTSALLAAPYQPSYRWFASTDPRNDNEDYLLLKPGETRRIPLAAGRLLRLWSTSSQPDKLELQLRNGSAISLLRDGKAAQGELYQKAFTLYPSGGTPTAVRTLRSGATLIATNRSKEESKFFYQVSIAPVTTDGSLPVAPRPAAEPAWKSYKVATGQEIEILPTAKAAGVILQLRFKVQAGGTLPWQDLRLRAYWDGAATPAVDVPLASLACQFFKPQSSKSALWTFNAQNLDFFAPMPYGKGSRVVLFNSGAEAETVACAVTVGTPPPAQPMPYRFCAADGVARVQTGKPVQMLKVQGSGAFIGLNLGIAPTADSRRRSFAYLEGNETITVDGKPYEGTGTEDFFNSAWYFPEKPFSQPYGGVTWKQALPPQVATYRLMVNDALTFRKTLNFALEHGNGNRGNDLNYRWVAFWYQKPPLSFEVNDVKGAQTMAQESAGAEENQTTSPILLLSSVALGIGLLVVLLKLKANRAS